MRQGKRRRNVPQFGDEWIAVFPGGGVSDMRIGTYNVQGFSGYPAGVARSSLGPPGGEAAATRWAAALAALGCDVLALQEGPPPGQMTRVAAALSAGLVTFRSPMHWPGHLLSHLSVEDECSFTRWRPLPDRGPFSRMGGAALLRAPAGNSLWVVNLHLHPRTRAIRDREALIVSQRLAAFLSIRCPYAVVVGDLNCAPGEAVHHGLQDLGFVNAMEAVGGGVRSTHDSTGASDHPVDHIYVSSALRSALVKAWIVRDEGYAYDGPLPKGEWLYSDHLPVVADLDL